MAKSKPAAMTAANVRKATQAAAEKSRGSAAGKTGTGGKRSRGRPPFIPTTRQREQVVIAAAGSMKHADIAEALGITRPTLAKHFAKELSDRVTVCRLEIMEGMHQAALRGNVSAARLFIPATVLNQPTKAGPSEADIDAAKRAQREAQMTDRETKAPKLGKKEQAHVDARTAHVGTDWEDLLPSGPVQ